MAQANTRSNTGFSELDFMNRHVNALFTHDDHGRLRRVNESDGAQAPRFFLGRTSAGNIWRFRFDLPDSLTEHLESLCLKEPVLTDLRQEPAGLSEYISLLETHSPVKKLSSGPAYFFPDAIGQTSSQAVLVTPENVNVLRQGFEDWLLDVHRQPFLAILDEGHAVSVCCSVRVTAEAHEAGVETLNDYKGRGCASDIVQQWAAEVLKLGAMPLYSTSWQNVASQGVARRLGLIQYGSDFHVT
ncbi:MAG TPA: GNAT family N-acetyltransferase [Pyrinomonadaceae bacterium]